MVVLTELRHAADDSSLTLNQAVLKYACKLAVPEVDIVLLLGPHLVAEFVNHVGQCEKRLVYVTTLSKSWPDGLAFRCTLRAGQVNEVYLRSLSNAPHGLQVLVFKNDVDSKHSVGP